MNPPPFSPVPTYRSNPALPTAVVEGYQAQRPEQLQQAFEACQKRNTALYHMGLQASQLQGHHIGLLNLTFFSAQNINDLQQQIVNRVYHETGMRLPFQDLKVLVGDMTELFGRYLPELGNTEDPAVVRDAVLRMNRDVVTGCGNKVISGVTMEMFRRRSQSHLPEPVRGPQSTTDDRVMTGSIARMLR